LCNYGLAMAYFAPELHHNKPLEEHWLMRAGAEDFSRLVDYRDEYAAGARKFESSNRANPNLMLMLEAALTLNENWGPARIANYLQNLTSNACERTPNIFGVRGFSTDDPTRSLISIVAKLQTQNIFVSVRGSAMRVSPHVYNNAEDLERFVNCLIAP
jgi:selenocysteine lyase/cysteine desulfurase